MSPADQANLSLWMVRTSQSDLIVKLSISVPIFRVLFFAIKKSIVDSSGRGSCPRWSSRGKSIIIVGAFSCLEFQCTSIAVLLSPFISRGCLPFSTMIRCFGRSITVPVSIIRGRPMIPL
ncbi:hypothetical protein M5689_003615 [Euphorbia peplus]|nr:hypothetical protein M5689_003615 [Euphorbia peplus]